MEKRRWAQRSQGHATLPRHRPRRLQEVMIFFCFLIAALTGFSIFFLEFSGIFILFLINKKITGILVYAGWCKS